MLGLYSLGRIIAPLGLALDLVLDREQSMHHS